MNNQSLRQRLILACAVAGIAVSPILAGNSFAQSKPKATPRATPRPAAPRNRPATPPPVVEEDNTPAPAVKGLNGLGDDLLLGELSSRGLETLLVKAFDDNKVPDAQRSGFRALRGLRQLTEPAAKKLTPGKRQELISQVVTGLKSVLPQINDPRKLMEASAILLSEGSDRDVNLLEYWGETAATQARLKSVVDSATAMLDKALKAAGSEQAVIERRMKNPNDKRAADEWTALDDLKTLGGYTRNMAAYYVALGTPRSDMATREKVVHDAMEALKEYDADDSGFQTIVKLRMGKMLMTKGAYAEAKTALAEVSTLKTKPAPSPAQVDQAKYFSIVCDLQSGDVATANKEIAALIEWEGANIPKEDQKGTAAAAELLRYRIALAEAELSQGEDKKNFDKKAQDILLKLAVDRPDLSGLIYEQLVERVGTQPVKGMNPLLLRALMRKAESETALDKPNPAVLERGTEAAREIVARAATDKSLEASLVESAMFFAARFQEVAGKKIEAANGYMDFVQKYPKSESSLAAFNAAGRLIIVDLRSGDRKGDADVVAAFDRFLPVAIKPPFNRKEYAFDYAQRLRKQKPAQLKEAATYYAMVAPTDQKYAFAKYYQLISLTGMLDERLPTKKPAVAGKDREALVAQILQVADEVKKVGMANAAKAGTDKKKSDNSRIQVAQATLIAAQIAADEQKDGKKVLQILATFEKDTEGMPGADDMMKDVMSRRVRAFMDAGQDNDATATVLTLLNKTGGQEGANFVLGLLQRLNDNYKKAEANGDTPGMTQIAKNRALLSGFLVKWASTSTKPEIRKFVYSYSVFDAESKLLAGRLNKDQVMLKSALDAFQKLMEPASVALYKKEIENNPKALEDFKAFPYHRNVMLGLGLTQFEVGDFKNAQQNIGQLVFNRKLGNDQIEKIDPVTGDSTFVDNDTFWEAWYKLLRSNVELYKADRSGKDADVILAAAKSGLKKLYILNRHPGGDRWGTDLEKLRTEIIPDFDPASIPVSAPSTRPSTTQATQPVAKG